LDKEGKISLPEKEEKLGSSIRPGFNFISLKTNGTLRLPFLTSQGSHPARSGIGRAPFEIKGGAF